MSITAWDIKEAAFASDVREVEELILTNKGATDVGAVAQAVRLRSLSLAFNALSSLSGLAPLTALTTLNVSHNQLASLKGVQALASLASLNISHNKLASLAPLSALTALTDLWLSSNALAAPSELRVLAGLPRLQRLALSGNPALAKALPGDSLRMAAVALCPGLRLVDGRPVEESERQGVSSTDLDALLAGGGGAGSGAGGGGSSSWGGSATSRSDARPSSLGRGGTPPTPSARAAVRAGGSAGSVGSSGLPARSLRSPAGDPPAGRSRARCNSDSLLSGGASFFSEAEANGRPTASRSSGLAAADQLPSAEDAIAAALEAVASFGSTTSSGSSRGTMLGSRRRAAAAAAAASGIPRPAPQLQDTAFQAVVDALPRFDPGKLPVKYSPQRSASEAAARRPPLPRPPPPEATVVEHEARYPAARGGGRAVVVRRDGSAAAFWPGGDMAVTVDADYTSASTSTSAAADGGGGEAVWAVVQPASYKLMAMYRAGGVAASWDTGGGFVQYPGGGLMLMYSRATGTGSCYSPTGEVTRRWRDVDAPPVDPDAAPRAIAVPSLLGAATPTTPAPPPPPPPSHIDQQLDPHLGVRYLSASHQLELYLSCEGLRYRLRCGRNTANDTWEPPPGRGDSATGTPYASTPPTPGASSRHPTLSTGGDLGGGSGDLPPPAFLRNLARQGGAGTHRPVQAGGGGGGGGGSKAPAAAGAGGADGAGGEPGFASIAAGLQELEHGLQAMLHREPRGPGSTSASSTLRLEASSASSSDLVSPSAATGSSAAAAGALARRQPSIQGRRGGGGGLNAARALAADAAAANGDGAGAARGSDVGGTAGEEDAPAPRRGLDADVASQLAAARRLAADSLAAAAAASDAVAALGAGRTG